jgi:hypothetical protein
MKWVVLLLSLLSLGGCGECPVCPKLSLPEEYEVMPIQTWYDLTTKPWDPDLKNGLGLVHSLVTSTGGSYFALFQPQARTMNNEIWDMAKRTKVWGDTNASSYYGYLAGGSYVYLGSKLFFFRVGSGGLTLSSFDPATGTVSNHQTHALDFTTSSSDYPYGVIYCDGTLKKVFYAWTRYRPSTSNSETVHVWQYDMVADSASEITTISGTDYLARSLGSDGTYLYLEVPQALANGYKITIADGTTTSETLPSGSISAVGYNGFYFYSTSSTLTLKAPSGGPSWNIATDLSISPSGAALLIDDTKGYPYRVVMGYVKRVGGSFEQGIRVLSLNNNGSIVVHLNTYDPNLYSAVRPLPMIGPMLGYPDGFRNQMIAGFTFATGWQIDYHKVSVE